VSSYIPSLRALAYARSRPRARERRLITVSMPTTPEMAPLPGTVAEAETIARRYSGSMMLTAEAATVAEVIGEISSSTWVHFACHATIDPAGSHRTADYTCATVNC